MHRYNVHLYYCRVQIEQVACTRHAPQLRMPAIGTYVRRHINAYRSTLPLGVLRRNLLRSQRPLPTMLRTNVDITVPRTCIGRSYADRLLLYGRAYVHTYIRTNAHCHWPYIHVDTIIHTCYWPNVATSTHAGYFTLLSHQRIVRRHVHIAHISNTYYTVLRTNLRTSAYLTCIRT
jgi:hypothetical protein